MTELRGWELSSNSINLPLQEKGKTPIVDSDRGRFWRRPPEGDATTHKWGLASHEPAVVVQSRWDPDGRFSRGVLVREQVRPPGLLQALGDLPLLLSRTEVLFGAM